MTGEEDLRKSVWYRRFNRILEEIRKGDRSDEVLLRLVYCALKNYDAFYSAAMAQTAEEALNEADAYCEKIGNRAVAKVMREHYEKIKELPLAIITTLKLEKVIMYRRRR